MYQLLPVFPNTPVGAAQCIKRITDNAFIPFDPANTDYQEYLKWLAAGNQPIPANAGEGNEPLPSDSVTDETPSTNP